MTFVFINFAQVIMLALSDFVNAIGQWEWIESKKKKKDRAGTVEKRKFSLRHLSPGAEFFIHAKSGERKSHNFTVKTGTHRIMSCKKFGWWNRPVNSTNEVKFSVGCWWCWVSVWVWVNFTDDLVGCFGARTIISATIGVCEQCTS